MFEEIGAVEGKLGNISEEYFIHVILGCNASSQPACARGTKTLENICIAPALAYLHLESGEFRMSVDEIR